MFLPDNRAIKGLANCIVEKDTHSHTRTPRNHIPYKMLIYCHCGPFHKRCYYAIAGKTCPEKCLNTQSKSAEFQFKCVSMAAWPQIYDKRKPF